METNSCYFLKRGYPLLDPQQEIIMQEINPENFNSPSSAITYSVSESPFGEFIATVTPDGMAELHFTDGNANKFLSDYRKRHSRYWVCREDSAGELISKKVLLDRFSGPIRLAVSGTPFQKEVWAALLDIPFGETVTYSELARRLGRPGAVRAVAGAVAKNKIAFMIPCHRVVRSDGSVGGYRWGLERKKLMIEWEKRVKARYGER